VTKSDSRFLLATVLTAAGGIALTLALWTPVPAMAPAYAAGAAFLIVILLLILPARQDLDAVLLWVAGVALGSALLLGIYLLSAYRPGETPKQAAGLAALVGLGAFAWTWKRQGSPEDPDLPDVLAAVAGVGPIREANRVQFGAVVHPGGGTEPHRVEVTFQNCCTAPRKARFDVRGPLTRTVLAPVPAWVEIGPLEVHRLILPIRTEKQPGATAVDILLAVAGDGGRRLRLRRARKALPHSKLDPVGYLRVHLDPLPAVGAEAPLPAPRHEIVWRPRAGTFAADAVGA